MIVPSIDLVNGRAVQLRRGSEKILESETPPVELAKQFGFHGEVAVVDLDAALGRGDNGALIRELCRVAECRVGGGVRTEQDVTDLIRAGASRVVIGTAASAEFLARFPKDWIVVALDAKKGRTVDHGWTRETGDTPVERARALAGHCSGFLFTQVEVEGTLQGVPLDPVRELMKATSVPLTVAGGVRDLADVRSIEALGAEAQIGMALYTGAIDMNEAAATAPDWTKGPVPTIAQDADGRVLMLAYSTEASLREALSTRRGVYWSRSRNEIWRKGDTSGHEQSLAGVRYDCDADTLLFTIDQKGPACHTNRPTCFGEPPRFGLAALRRVVQARRGADASRSWTARLLSDRSLLHSKIREEAGEVCDAPNHDNLVWELADLLYHVTVLMESTGIALEEVEAELRGRRR